MLLRSIRCPDALYIHPLLPSTRTELPSSITPNHATNNLRDCTSFDLDIHSTPIRSPKDPESHRNPVEASQRKNVQHEKGAIWRLFSASALTISGGMVRRGSLALRLKSPGQGLCARLMHSDPPFCGAFVSGAEYQRFKKLSGRISVCAPRNPRNKTAPGISIIGRNL